MSTIRTHDLLEDHGADFKFPKNFGHKLTFKATHGWTKKRVTVRSVYRFLDNPKTRNLPREAHLRITSFVGISPGASHSYARIELGYPSFEYLNGRHFGFSLSSEEIPFGAKHVALEITRRSDKRDVKYDKEQARFSSEFSLYGHRKIGDWTYQFWSEAEALEAAKKWFLDHFGPGWILVPDAWSEEVRPIYATT